MFSLKIIDHNDKDVDIRNLISELCLGNLGILVIKNFYHPNTKKLHDLQKYSVSNFTPYVNIDHTIEKFGITQFELQKDPYKYFQQSEKYLSMIVKLLGENPMNKVIELLNFSGIDSSIASDNGNLYFYSLLRKLVNAKLHVDYVKKDAKGWSIHSVDYQLACNIILQAPSKDGTTIVYNKKWELEDDHLKTHDSYQYDDTVVKDVDFISYAGEKGDLILFPSNNFHKVIGKDNKTSTRLTISSFIGINNNFSRAIFWS